MTAPDRVPGGAARRRLGAVLPDSAKGILFGVVPGLAHAMKGRFKEVRLWVALWCLCMVLGVFFYSTTAGSLLIGLAIGLHAWIAVQYGAFWKVTEFATRAGVVLIVMACLTALYWAAPRLVVGGFTGGYTTFPIRAMHIQAGDYVLIRGVSDSDHPLARGTLVQIHPPSFAAGRLNAWLNRRDAAIGQIAGLPGETIRVAGGVYVVGEHSLDPAQFPVPGWLRRSEATPTVSIPQDSYFVSTEYVGYGRLTPEILRQACLVPASEIRGRAFMRWWPVATRGFIE